MGALPEYKDIMDLIKKGATLEAQEKIIQLREAVLELKEENFALRDQIKTLQERLDIRGKMTFRHPYYFMDDDPKPFCPTCWENNDKAIHLLGDGGNTEYWNCAVCKKAYELNK